MPSRTLRRLGAAGSLLAWGVLATAPPAGAQSVAQELLRPGPRPARVTHGEAVAFARTFAVAASSDRALLLYTENAPNGTAALRGALLSAEGAGEAEALVRVRDDLVLAPDVRTLAVAWDGTRGLAVLVVPPPRRPPGTAANPAPRRPPPLGLPPAFPDTLGPEQSSGGDIVALPLDAQGAPAGPLRVLFHEHTRAARVAVTAIPDGYLVAWTGSAVTDDEVVGTVRLLRLDTTGAPRRAAALASGLFGDLGDGLHLQHRAGQSVLAVVASRCAAREGEAPPADAPGDASALIEPPNRALMPQLPAREQPGPPIVCGPMALHRAVVADTVGPWAPPLALRGHSLAGSADGLVVVAHTASDSPGPAPGALVRVSGVDPGVTPFAATPLPPLGPPAYRAVDLSPRRRPPPDDPLPAPHEAPRPGPELGPPAEALTAPEALAVVGDALVAVAPGRRAVAVFTRDGRSAWTHRTEAPVIDLAALSLGRSRWVLQREALWSGPVRALRLADPGPSPAEPPLLPRRTAVRVAPAPPGRYPLRAHYTWDETFARLWVHARTLRGQFMAYEYTAGILAARPTAPTDPRMPGIVATRNRLRSRWESACSPLQTRASALARQGAGAEILEAVRQLCDLHADLQLGVPINPAL